MKTGSRHLIVASVKPYRWYDSVLSLRHDRAAIRLSFARSSPLLLSSHRPGDLRRRLSAALRTARFCLGLGRPAGFGFQKIFVNPNAEWIFRTFRKCSILPWEAGPSHRFARRVPVDFRDTGSQGDSEMTASSANTTYPLHESVPSRRLHPNHGSDACREHRFHSYRSAIFSELSRPF